jgi:uncharacterized Ntn-hydrolase superfamily protein
MRPLVVLAVVLLPRVAFATYSIAATDSATKQVGGSVTSCVSDLDVGIVYGSSPGHGVVHAQAVLDPQSKGKTRAVKDLGADVAPASIVSTITQTSFDPGVRARQFGIVDLAGRAAGFSGGNATAYKGDRQGSFGTFTYSVQGNILTSEAVLDQNIRAFEAGGCDLADRLMRALEGGAQNGEGDSRCTGPKGIPADSAFIEVDEAEGAAGSYLKISVRDTGSESAVTALRARFDVWRLDHPCPSPAPRGVDAGPDARPSLGTSTAESAGCGVSSGAASTTGIPLVLALLGLRRARRHAQRRRTAIIRSQLFGANDLQ